jgi:dTDP-4-amino-4,6-dideoxygalactose transaminase
VSSQPVIPFSRVSPLGRELQYVNESVRSGQIMGDNAFTRRCQELLTKRIGVPGVLLTTSCTHALEMSGLLLDLRPGDQVILPSFTFVSTANAFVLRGAQPIFIDCRPDTLNIDERQLERLITKRTKAIVVVHYAGVACEMDAIMEIARQHNIPVIEDNAHGLCGRYRGRELGTFGVMSTLSFHSTKNFSCGEGGAIVLNDPELIERAEILREKGTNRSRFFRGQVDKYTWVDVGSSYVASDILAAFLLGQLEAETPIQTNRRRVWEAYQRELRGWAEERGIGQPVVPEGCEHSWHIYHLLLPSLERRQKLIEHMAKRGVTTVFHYLPLHLAPMARQLEPNPPSLPVTESISDRLLRLPMFGDMTDTELDRIIDALRAWK